MPLWSKANDFVKRNDMSIWSGSSEDSWFSYDKLQKYRTIKNPELHAINRLGPNQFYILSADIGRLNDSTVVSVLRVNVDKNGIYYCTLVNLFVLGREASTKTFYQQCIDLKKIIQAFNPREVVIDTNGLTN